jgi:hypothetical protein
VFERSDAFWRRNVFVRLAAVGGGRSHKTRKTRKTRRLAWDSRTSPLAPRYPERGCLGDRGSLSPARLWGLAGGAFPIPQAGGPLQVRGFRVPVRCKGSPGRPMEIETRSFRMQINLSQIIV